MLYSKLNTLQARQYIREHVLHETRDLRIWRCWTEECRAWEALGSGALGLRNLVFGLGGTDKITEEELAEIQRVVGCKRAHTTANGSYLRLNWVDKA